MKKLLLENPLLKICLLSLMLVQQLQVLLRFRIF